MRPARSLFALVFALFYTWDVVRFVAALIGVIALVLVLSLRA